MHAERLLVPLGCSGDWKVDMKSLLLRSLFASLLLAGCGEYSVRIVVEDQALLERTSAIEVALVPDCSSQNEVGLIVGDLLRYTLDDTAPSFGDVDPGARGLFVRLMDSECNVVASGCSTVLLEAGGSGELVVRAQASSGDACGGSQVCRAGFCENPPADAGVDAPPDTPVDAASCDDCTSSACETATCIAGECLRTPLEDGASCEGGTCRSGACCMGCWSGSECVSGESAGACGASGEECVSCDCPTPTCGAGTCTSQPAFRHVSIGQRHSCFILQSGELYCAGNNTMGQLGLGDTSAEPVLTPRRVGEDSDWETVSAGLDHTCGLRTGGALYCWGDNTSGQLGLGIAVATSTSPARVGEAFWRRIVLSPTRSYSFAQSSEGLWFAWGANNTRIDLRVGSSAPAVFQPAEVEAPAPDRSWAQLSTVAGHMAGLDNEGALYCWGDNRESQCGAEPSEEFVFGLVDAGPFDWVHASRFGTCVIAEGALACMGDVTVSTSESEVSLVPIEIGNVDAQLGGYAQHCVAIDGAALCWGSNAIGELGLGTFASVRFPALVDWFDISRLAFSRRAAYAWDASLSTNLIWGENAQTDGGLGDGRLGLGDLVDRSAPAPICIDETAP